MPEDARLYKDILDHLYDGVYFVDRERRITYWNQGAERITGYSAGRVVGSRCADNLLMHVTEGGVALCTSGCPLTEAMGDGQAHEAEAYLHHADGHRLPVLVRVTPIRDATGTIVGATEVFSDNAAMIAARQHADELQRTLWQDPLTGVGNRRYVERRIESSLAELQRGGPPFGVLFTEVDRFKEINDTFGHDVGDQVLTMVAHTLSRNTRSSDLIGRWGGEEFVVALFNVSAQQLVIIGNKLRVLVARSRLSTPQGDIQVTVSLGATLVRKVDNPDSLLKRADQLLYQARNGGRNRVVASS
jgi:diguanylate cyclase (GGDEF)-like protein/PAS domain S-box-containing protein